MFHFERLDSCSCLIFCWDRKALNHVTGTLCSVTVLMSLPGNCVVLKPSEVSAATDAVFAELIPKYLSQVKFLFCSLQLTSAFMANSALV